MATSESCDISIKKIFALLNGLQSTYEEYHNYQDKCRDIGDSLLRHIRGYYGMSQDNLAACLGVSKTYISRIENRHSVIGVPTLLRLAEVIRELEDIISQEETYYE